MKLLALDLSTTETGYAIMEAEKNKHPKVIKSGIIKVPSSLTESALKIIHVIEEVVKMIVHENIEDAVSEDIYFKFGRVNAFLALAKLQGAFIFAYYKRKLRSPEHISASEARSALGLANKKELAMKEFNKKYKTKYTNDNEIDAIIQGFAYCKLRLKMYRSIQKGEKIT
jgi:Holliday junction resolvasome RuvABC endonuclease subunit